jgi:hypothetical protein
MIMLVLVTGTTSACMELGAAWPNHVPGGQNADCTVQVQNAHQSKNTPNSIDAKATISCTAAVTDVLLAIKLEQKSGSSWMVVARNDNYDGGKSPKIGSLTAGQSALRQVEYDCRDGVYRAAARGSAVLDGVPSSIG